MLFLLPLRDRIPAISQQPAGIVRLAARLVKSGEWIDAEGHARWPGIEWADETEAPAGLAAVHQLQPRTCKTKPSGPMQAPENDGLVKKELGL